MRNNIIIATGGTGGHIIPAVALADYFIKNKYNVIITGDSNTKKYINNDKITFYELESGSSVKKIKSLFRIFIGFLHSFKIIQKTKPDAIIGFGCYRTFPILLASKFKKVPIFLHEGNSVIGKVNRLFLKDCVNIFTSFQEIYGMDVKQSEKIIFSGSVIREGVKKYYNTSYKIKKSNKINILITGGSGGASFFSTEFIKVFSFLEKDIKSRLFIFHQVKTEEELNLVKSFYNKENIKSKVSLFFDDLPQKIYNSDLVVCRCGIGTTSELSVIGRASIMVPSPNVTNNHQFYNGKFFQRSGACYLLEENQFSPKDFVYVLLDILNNRLVELSNNIKAMAVIDADKVIYTVVNDFVNNNKKMKQL